MDVRDQLLRRAAVIRPAFLACGGALAIGASACRADRAPPPARDTAPVAIPIPPPPRTLSRFDAPLAYDFTPVLSTIERVVPRTFGSLDSLRSAGRDGRRFYAFTATRDGFTAQAEGNQLHLRTTLTYRARGFYKPPFGPTISAGCGSNAQAPRIVVEFATPLTVTADWHLQSAVRLVRVAPASTAEVDECTVSVLSYDVTARVVGAARSALRARLAAIDSTIAAVDLTPLATEWWTALSQPIRLDDRVWLTLQPQRLRLGALAGSGHMLTVRAGLDAYPVVVTGSEPDVVVSQLPTLAPDTAVSGFHIVLETTLDYKTASRVLTSALQGKTVSQAGRSIAVRSVYAFPAVDGRLAVAVEFAGDANGTLRLVGTPTYRATDSSVVLRDLDYDLNTDNGLLKAYAWLRSASLLALLRDHARVPLADVVQRGRALLVSGLNRTVGGTLTISTTVDSIQVLGLYVTPPGILVRTSASGQAGLLFRQPP